MESRWNRPGNNNAYKPYKKYMYGEGPPNNGGYMRPNTHQYGQPHHYSQHPHQMAQHHPHAPPPPPYHQAPPNYPQHGLGPPMGHVPPPPHGQMVGPPPPHGHLPQPPHSQMPPPHGQMVGPPPQTLSSMQQPPPTLNHGPPMSSMPPSMLNNQMPSMQHMPPPVHNMNSTQQPPSMQTTPPAPVAIKPDEPTVEQLTKENKQLKTIILRNLDLISMQSDMLYEKDHAIYSRDDQIEELRTRNADLEQQLQELRDLWAQHQKQAQQAQIPAKPDHEQPPPGPSQPAVEQPGDTILEQPAQPAVEQPSESTLEQSGKTADLQLPAEPAQEQSADTNEGQQTQPVNIEIQASETATLTKPGTNTLPILGTAPSPMASLTPPHCEMDPTLKEEAAKKLQAAVTADITEHFPDAPEERSNNEAVDVVMSEIQPLSETEKLDTVFSTETAAIVLETSATPMPNMDIGIDPPVAAEHKAMTEILDMEPAEKAPQEITETDENQTITTTTPITIAPAKDVSPPIVTTTVTPLTETISSRESFSVITISEESQPAEFPEAPSVVDDDEPILQMSGMITKTDDATSSTAAMDMDMSTVELSSSQQLNNSSSHHDTIVTAMDSDKADDDHYDDVVVLPNTIDAEITIPNVETTAIATEMHTAESEIQADKAESSTMLDEIQSKQAEAISGSVEASLNATDRSNADVEMIDTTITGDACQANDVQFAVPQLETPMTRVVTAVGVQMHATYETPPQDSPPLSSNLLAAQLSPTDGIPAVDKMQEELFLQPFRAVQPAATEAAGYDTTATRQRLFACITEQKEKEADTAQERSRQESESERRPRLEMNRSYADLTAQIPIIPGIVKQSSTPLRPFEENVKILAQKVFIKSPLTPMHQFDDGMLTARDDISLFKENKSSADSPTIKSEENSQDSLPPNDYGAVGDTMNSDRPSNEMLSIFTGIAQTTPDFTATLMHTVRTPTYEGGALTPATTPARSSDRGSPHCSPGKVSATEALRNMIAAHGIGQQPQKVAPPKYPQYAHILLPQIGGHAANSNTTRTTQKALIVTAPTSSANTNVATQRLLFPTQKRQPKAKDVFFTEQHAKRGTIGYILQPKIASATTTTTVNSAQLFAADLAAQSCSKAVTKNISRTPPTVTATPITSAASIIGECDGKLISKIILQHRGNLESDKEPNSKPKQTTVESTSPKQTIVESTSPKQTTVESTSPKQTIVESTSPKQTIVESTSPKQTIVESTSPKQEPINDENVQEENFVEQINLSENIPKSNDVSTEAKFVQLPDKPLSDSDDEDIKNELAEAEAEGERLQCPVLRKSHTAVTPSRVELVQQANVPSSEVSTIQEPFEKALRDKLFQQLKNTKILELDLHDTLYDDSKDDPKAAIHGNKISIEPKRPPTPRSNRVPTPGPTRCPTPLNMDMEIEETPDVAQNLEYFDHDVCEQVVANEQTINTHEQVGGFVDMNDLIECDVAGQYDDNNYDTPIEDDDDDNERDDDEDDADDDNDDDDNEENDDDDKGGKNNAANRQRNDEDDDDRVLDDNDEHGNNRHLNISPFGSNPNDSNSGDDTSEPNCRRGSSRDNPFSSSDEEQQDGNNSDGWSSPLSKRFRSRSPLFPQNLITYSNTTKQGTSTSSSHQDPPIISPAYMASTSPPPHSICGTPPTPHHGHDQQLMFWQTGNDINMCEDTLSCDSFDSYQQIPYWNSPAGSITPPTPGSPPPTPRLGSPTKNEICCEAFDVNEDQAKRNANGLKALTNGPLNGMRNAKSHDMGNHKSSMAPSQKPEASADSINGIIPIRQLSTLRTVTTITACTTTATITAVAATTTTSQAGSLSTVGVTVTTSQQQEMALPKTRRYMYTNELYCTREWMHKEFEEEEAKACNDSQNLEIPKWTEQELTANNNATDGEEDLKDDTYLKRHSKEEKNEKKRKRWDVQQQMEQLKNEKLKQRHCKEENKLPPEPPPLLTFYPDPDDIKAIQYVDNMPVQSFGEPIFDLPRVIDFGLPWEDDTCNTRDPCLTLAPKLTPPTPGWPPTRLPSIVCTKPSNFTLLKKRKRAPAGRGKNGNNNNVNSLTNAITVNGNGTVAAKQSAIGTHASDTISK